MSIDFAVEYEIHAIIRKFFECYGRDDDNFLNSIVTRVETLVVHCTPETKRQTDQYGDKPLYTQPESSKP